MRPDSDVHPGSPPVSGAFHATARTPYHPVDWRRGSQKSRRRCESGQDRTRYADQLSGAAHWRQCWCAIPCTGGCVRLPGFRRRCNPISRSTLRMHGEGRREKRVDLVAARSHQEPAGAHLPHPSDRTHLHCRLFRTLPPAHVMTPAQRSDVRHTFPLCFRRFPKRRAWPGQIACSIGRCDMAFYLADSRPAAHQSHLPLAPFAILERHR